jgi:putative redox protein
MKYKMSEPVHASISTIKYQCVVEWRNGKFLSDEPEETEGQDSGPDPFTLLLSSIATCTLITLRMYIDRKGWDIPAIAVNANLFQILSDEKLQTTIDRDIIFKSEVAEEQQLKLRDIASRCPISRLMEGDVAVRTFVQRQGQTKQIKYSNDEISVVWKPGFCQHSTRCWTQLLQVFNPQVGKWINPDGASAARIEKQVKNCPSGALEFYYNNTKPENKEV